MTEDRRRGVDGKVVARIQRARRNQSQHTYQRLGDHGAVSDEASVCFLVQHLGRGAGSHQRVKARDRTARDGHKKERVEISLDDRSAAMNELREVWKFDVGMNHEDADDQHGDRAQLDVGREIVARFQYQPDGKNRRHQPVDGHKVRDLVRSKGKRSGKSGLSDPVPGDHAADQKDDAKNAGAGDGYLPGMAFEHPPSHDDGNGDGHADGEDAPGTIRQRVDHYDAEAGERDQQNKEDGDHRHQAGEGTDLSAGNIR